MENKYAEKLIKEYSEKEVSKLSELKALDKKVKNPARIFAYIFGVIGCLILGTGMCLAMKVIGNTTLLMIVGIIIGLIGITLVSITYPIYKRILYSRKNRYSKEIIAKSNEILNQKI